jgi:hypothetical protein
MRVMALYETHFCNGKGNYVKNFSGAANLGKIFPQKILTMVFTLR